jgi:hypothetical protein
LLRKVAHDKLPKAEPVLSYTVACPMAVAQRFVSIATALKISPGTVSRSLREYPGVHPEVRQRVRAMAESMGYTVRGEGARAIEGVTGAGRSVQAPDASPVLKEYPSTFIEGTSIAPPRT